MRSYLKSSIVLSKVSQVRGKKKAMCNVSRNNNSYNSRKQNYSKEFTAVIEVCGWGYFLAGKQILEQRLNLRRS